MEELLLGSIRLRMIPVLDDNFIYLLDDGEKAILIDAGDGNGFAIIRSGVNLVAGIHHA